MEKFFNYKNIAIYGVPRSGTSWIGEIFNSSPNTAYRYQPLFSYAHKDFLNNYSTQANIEEFFSRLITCEDDFTNQTEKRNRGDFPLFKKNIITHIIYKEVRYINLLKHMMSQSNDLKICAVIRNPFSVINSWLNAEREFRKDLGWNVMEEWRYANKKNLNKPEEFNGYEKWKEATNIFMFLKNLYPDRIYILRYENLLNNIVQETRKLFDFTGIEITAQTRSFLVTSTNTKTHTSNTYTVYRNNQTDDKWKTQLPETIIYSIQKDIEHTELAIFSSSNESL